MSKSILLDVFPGLSASVSLVLMGIAGIRLLVRMPALLAGQEDPLPRSQEPLPVKGMLWAATAMLLMRLAIILLAWGMHWAQGEGAGLLESFRGYWEHWDVRHYVGIAENGYVTEGNDRLRLVFFPLYPVLMRLLSPAFGGDVFYAGTALSIVVACISSAMLYALAFFWRGARAAGFSVACFLVNPMSVFLGCVYTESLFLCLCLLCALLLTRSHPWGASLAGMAAAFTRMPGALLAGLFLIEGLYGILRERRRLRRLVVCVARMLVVFSGLFLYFAVNRALTGSAFTYLTYQRENWFQQAGTFWDSAANTAHYLVTTYGDSDWLWTWGFQLIAMFYGFFLLAFRQGRLPFSLAAFSFVYVMVVFSPTWLLSGARYLYGLFALPLLQSCCGERRGARVCRLLLSGILLICFVYGYTIEIAVL